MLTFTQKEMFSIDSRADEYGRLMDASVEIANVVNKKDDDSKINVDWYLKDAVDWQPSSLENWNAEKAQKSSWSDCLLDSNMFFFIIIPTP